MGCTSSQTAAVQKEDVVEAGVQPAVHVEPPLPPDVLPPTVDSPHEEEEEPSRSEDRQLAEEEQQRRLQQRAEEEERRKAPTLLELARSDNAPAGVWGDVWMQSSFGVQLDELVRKHKYLEPQHCAQRHPLHNVLRRCRQSSELRRFGQANAHLQTIKAGLRAEEKLVNQAFRYFDLDKSGHIDESEFRRMCAYLGWGDAEKVKLMDLDGDGKVTLPDVQGFAGHMGGVSQLFERRRLRISASRHDVCDYASITVGTRVLAHFYTRQQKSVAWKEATVTAVGVEHRTTEDLMGPVTLGVELEFRFGPGDRWGMRQVVPMSWVIANIEDATAIAALREVGILDEQQALWALLLPSTEMHTMSRLTSSQQLALKSVREKASKHHEDALPDVLERFRRLGYGQDELQAVLGWIQDLAPIIIHLNIDEVGRYLEIDETLRSQFEVRGEADPTVVEKVNQERHEREKRLFGGCYDDVEPFERVKYGALNVLNDFNGSCKAHIFGDSYLVLKDVRLRTTFTAKDSGDCTLEDMGLLDKYAHVLAGYQDKELKEVVAVATAAIAPASEGVRPKGAASLELLRGPSDDSTTDWITVGFPNLKQSSGCYYFEVHLHAGCLAPQVGLLSSKFDIRPNTKSTSGVGDDAHGWSVDGLNAARWHKGESKAWTICWGRSTAANPSASPETSSSAASGDSYDDEDDSCESSEYESESDGDGNFNDEGATSPDGLALSQDVVVGVAVDLDERTLRFSSNGRWEPSPAFTSNDIPEDNAELYPAISLKGRAAFIFGPKWKHSPPLARHANNAKSSNNSSVTGGAGAAPAAQSGAAKAGSSSADLGQKVVSITGWASLLLEGVTLVIGPGQERSYGRKVDGAKTSVLELADNEFLTRVDQGEAGTGEGLGASLTFHSDTRVLGTIAGVGKGARERTFRAPRGTHVVGLVFEGKALKSLDVACRDAIGVQMKPGKTGLVVDADGGKVVSLAQDGQAQFRGVELGWVLQSVDGQPYTEQLLQSKADSKAPYSLVFRCRGLMAVLFQPGELGLQIDTENGEILSVADGSQAQLSSVRERWVIHLVDGERFNDDLMKQKIAGKEAFTVAFRQQRQNGGSLKTPKQSPFAQWPGTPGTTIRVDCPEIGNSKDWTNYKEVQVHGEVNLKRNVQRLVVNSRYRIRPKTQRSFRLRVTNAAGPCNGIYHRMGAQGGRPLYKSNFGTIISWDPEESLWKASASPDTESAGRVFASASAGDGEPGEPPTSGWRVPDHEWGILELPDFQAALRDNGIDEASIKRLRELLTVQETTRWGEHIFKKTRNASFAEEWRKIKNPPLSADALWKEAIQKMQQRMIREAGLPAEALIVETQHPYKAEPWSVEVAIPGVPSLAVHFAQKTCTLDGRAALTITAGGLDRATAGPGARVEVTTVSGTVRGTLSERSEQSWCIRIDRRGTSPAPIKPSEGSPPAAEVTGTPSMGPSEATSQASLPPAGGDSSSVWHPQVGEAVEAQFQSGAWYKATITSVRNRGFDWYSARWQPAKFVVQWADGEKKDVEKLRHQLRKPLVPPVIRTQMDLEDVPRFSSVPLLGAECFARCAEAPRIVVATYGISKQESLSETFGPGPPGFQHDPGTGHLKGISKGGKAEEKGLKPEWIITSIDSESYTPEVFDKKVASGSTYVVKLRPKAPVNVTLEPGAPGMSIDSKTGKVTSVVDGGQAQKSGVSESLILEYVDGLAFTDELLKAKAAGSLQYRVGLRPPTGPGAENLTVGSEIEGFSLDRTNALAPIAISGFAGMGPAQAENVGVGWYLDVVATAQGLYGASGGDLLRLLDGIGGVRMDSGTGKLLDAAFANAEELLRRLNEELLPLTGVSLVFTNSPSTEKARLLGEVVAVYPEGQIVGSEVRLFKAAEKMGIFSANKHVQVESYLAPGPAQAAGIRADWVLDVDATRAVNPSKAKDLDTSMVQQNPNVLLPMSGITLVFKLPSVEKTEMFTGSGDADAEKWSCPELPGDTARFSMPFTDVSGEAEKRWGIWALVLPYHAPQPSQEQVDQLAEQCVEATRRAQGIEKEMRVERDDWGEARFRALCDRHGWDFEWMSTDGERRRRAMERQYFLQDTQEMVGVREVVKAAAQCRKGTQERSSCSL